MAAWQFDLFLIPKGEPMPATSEYGLDIPSVPATSALNAQKDLVEAFGQPWFMLENWIVYGIENGTRVDLHFDDTCTVEVRVRLDASVNNNAVLDAICTLASHLDCWYFDARGRQFIEPLREVVLQAMALSQAAKFVRRPRDFIENLPTA